MANALTHHTGLAARTARGIPGRTARVPYYELETDLEFSDYGRDSRFPPGWFILATPFLSLLIMWSLISLF